MQNSTQRRTLSLSVLSTIFTILLLFCEPAQAQDRDQFSDQQQWADFTVSSNPVKPNQEVVFDASVSEFPGVPVSWEWDFGDSTKAYSEVVSHTYTNDFERVVTLEVCDDYGNCDTRTIGLIVIDPLRFERREGYLTVRDGVKIEYALDLPLGDSPANGFPLVVKGHGGVDRPTFKNPEADSTQDVITGINGILRGYAVARFHSRGVQDSGGDMLFGGRDEALDIEEYITWLIDNAPINPERIGYMGGSHGGLIGLNLLVHDERLRAILPMNATTNMWNALMGDSTLKHEFFRHTRPWNLSPTGDSYSWKWNISLYSGIDLETTMQEMDDMINTDWLLANLEDRTDTVAVYLKINWTDMHFRGNEILEAFDEIQGMGIPVWLYAGYGGHNNYTTGKMEQDALRQNQTRNQFFDYWLMDSTSNGLDTIPPVTYVIYGTMDTVSRSFEYGFSEGLPLETGHLSLYLREDSRLSTEPPGSSESPDTISNILPGPLPEIFDDAGDILADFDILPDSTIYNYAYDLLDSAGTYSDRIPLCRICYTSDELADTLEMTGVPKVLYHLNSSGEEVLTVTEVIDVDPATGSKILVTLGPGGRKGITPGEDFSLSYDLYAFSYRFLPGHKIRLCVSNKSRKKILHWGYGLGNGARYPKKIWGDGPYYLAYFTESRTSIDHKIPQRASRLKIPMIGEIPAFVE